MHAGADRRDTQDKKELVGFQTGVRESAQSWRELLVDVKRRGLESAPDLAVGDGGLRTWKAIEEVFPGTRHQPRPCSGAAMLAIYVVILAHCFAVALSAKSQFGRLLAIGVTTTFFLHLFINMAMVVGLLPVVGVPLPLVSYGGSAIVSLMLGFVVMCVHVHRDVTIGRHATGESL